MSECIVFKELNLCDNIPEGLIELYISAFPANERREWRNASDIKSFLGNHPDMRIITAFSKGAFLGFISYWILKPGGCKIIYIEHLAIIETHRGNGFGQSLIKFLKEQHPNVDILLEVEPPVDNSSRQRIKFYERLELILHDMEYQQPPYSSNKKAIPLCIMSTPNISKEFIEDIIVPELHKKVYNVSPNHNI